MMDLALSVLALLAGCVSLELYTASLAPLGYQDENGFHPGIEARHGAEPCPGEQAN